MEKAVFTGGRSPGAIDACASCGPRERVAADDAPYRIGCLVHGCAFEGIGQLVSLPFSGKAVSFAGLGHSVRGLCLLAVPVAAKPGNSKPAFVLEGQTRRPEAIRSSSRTASPAGAFGSRRTTHVRPFPRID